ncbi:predicted protein [Uncinocarpus reesii 1704]|uniref:MARVEL domain-containing protein n=1 Tax=Uncinocarpus reesii (strain UAMH 1704) TaxID=336963 RepID=C4JT11_UNCRE|nr:uncharacterized protein UREG_05600 [Uncinocarpus reesii 1704]EEP80758.1 predicted protein [Uncinocarpus reesii 1704]
MATPPAPPAPSHQPATSPPPAPAAPANPDTITFTVNPRTLSMDEKAHGVPVSAVNPISVRPVQNKVVAPIGVSVAQAVILVSSFVATVLLGVSHSKETSNENGYYSYGYSLVPIVPIALGALWSLISLLLNHPCKVRVHPAFYVAFDLLLWLSILAISSCVIVLLSDRRSYACTYRSYRDSDSRCEAVLLETWGLQVAANALGLLSGLTHFGVFVWGCRMVHKTNAHARFEVSINMNGINNGQGSAPVVYA